MILLIYAEKLYYIHTIELFPTYRKRDLCYLLGEYAIEENLVKGIESISDMLNITCFLSFMDVIFYTITYIILLKANNFGAKAKKGFI